MPSQDVVLYEQPSPEPSVDVLLKLYSEICTSWRALVDVRFKLLGLVPAVSAVLLATLLLKAEQPDRRASGIVAAFGLVVTVALALYDQRNSQLHDELVSRGRRIEYELGVVCGQFRGRPASKHLVKHDVALALIYVSAAGAWVAVAVYLLLL